MRAVQPSTTVDHTLLPESGPVVVPIPLIVLLLGAYVAGGAAMFRHLYGAPDWPSAAYISLAAVLTIGGWYPDRPGTHDVAVGGAMWSLADARLIYASWLVVGLVLLSASLTLVLRALTTATCCPSCRRPSTQP